VARARFAAQAAQRRITETLALVEATGRPFTWWVGPASIPADLSAPPTPRRHYCAAHRAARERRTCCTARTKSASWSRVRARLSAM